MKELGLPARKYSYICGGLIPASRTKYEGRIGFASLGFYIVRENVVVIFLRIRGGKFILSEQPCALYAGWALLYKELGHRPCYIGLRTCDSSNQF